jgi:hypothetical protein
MDQSHIFQIAGSVLEITQYMTVKREYAQIRSVLCEGERLVGEWLMMAHGTKYGIANWAEPWGVFDLMVDYERCTLYELQDRVGGIFAMPSVLHIGKPN